MIKLTSPDIRKSDFQSAFSVIRSGSLTQGKYVMRFEEELTRYTHIPNAVVVSSGTAALHLSLLALGIKPGDHIVVSAFTFPATANVVENTGAKVLLCDVDLETYVATPEQIEAIIRSNPKKKIRAIIIVHEFGYPAQIKKIIRIARTYGLKVIEDAACALGTEADGHHPGFYSDAACISFHPRKAVTTGEGGAVITQNRELAAAIRILRNHGMSPSGNAVNFIRAGLNYRMTDFQAALAVGQLERFADGLLKRKKIVAAYAAHLGNLGAIRLPLFHAGHSWQSFMVVFDEKRRRDCVMHNLKDKEIETTIGAYALNCLSYYQIKYRVSPGSCPVSTELYEKGLVLPVHFLLSLQAVKTVCTAFKQILKLSGAEGRKKE